VSETGNARRNGTILRRMIEAVKLINLCAMLITSAFKERAQKLRSPRSESNRGDQSAVEIIIKRQGRPQGAKPLIFEPWGLQRIDTQIRLTARRSSCSRDSLVASETPDEFNAPRQDCSRSIDGRPVSGALARSAEP
jgi:hypothetical protein